MNEQKPTNVLVVDDEPYITEVLGRWLEEAGYAATAVASSQEALDVFGDGDFELLLLDIDLPDISGVDLLALLKEADPEVAAIMVTGNDDRDISRRSVERGAHAYIIKPFDEREVLIAVEAALEQRRRNQEMLQDRELLAREVRARTLEIRRREEEIALRLVIAAEHRDEESPSHVRRIGMFAEAISRGLGWPQEAVDDIRVAAPMHDIGKIGVPDGILLKSGRLTPEEFDVVKLHTKVGARLLKGSEIPLLQLAHDIALFHHEKWDGTGYPNETVGEQIPIAARIVAVADVYDSLTHDRVHRPAFSEDEALSMMQEARGTHFDPSVFDVFIEVLPAIRRIAEEVAEEGDSRE